MRPPRRVVDFPLDRDTFRNKSMEIVEDFDEKNYNNNGKWKSSRLLRVKQNFFIFSLFIIFRHFCVFSPIFSFFHFFVISHFLLFYVYFHFRFSSFFLLFSFMFFHGLSCSFIWFHELSFSVLFCHYLSFSLSLCFILCHVLYSCFLGFVSFLFFCQSMLEFMNTFFDQCA